MPFQGKYHKEDENERVNFVFSERESADKEKHIKKHPKAENTIQAAQDVEFKINYGRSKGNGI